MNFSILGTYVCYAVYCAGSPKSWGPLFNTGARGLYRLPRRKATFYSVKLLTVARGVNLLNLIATLHLHARPIRGGTAEHCRHFSIFPANYTACLLQNYEGTVAG